MQGYFKSDKNVLKMKFQKSFKQVQWVFKGSFKVFPMCFSKVFYVAWQSSQLRLDNQILDLTKLWYEKSVHRIPILLIAK